MAARVPGHRVLFVCVGNSTLSPMAEAFARRAGIDADSAGTMPAHEVSRGAVVALREKGIDLRNFRPKSLDFARLPSFERIVALDRGVAATSPDLHPHETWDLEDPVNLDFPVYRHVRDAIEARVTAMAQEMREWTGAAPGPVPARS